MLLRLQQWTLNKAILSIPKLISYIFVNFFPCVIFFVYFVCFEIARYITNKLYKRVLQDNPKCIQWF